MKKLHVIFIIIVSYTITVFLSCKKDPLPHVAEPAPFDTVNKAPLANAGFDQTIILPRDSVILDGSGSTDQDGTIKNYLWTKLSGPASLLIKNPDSAVTSVNNLLVGEYLFELRVMDDKGSMSKDNVLVKVTGPVECDITGIPQINATLTPIGTLSSPQTPYIVACGNKIIIAGGSHGYGGIDIYNVNEHTWGYAELSQPRTNMAIVSCGNKVFFAGGNNSDIWYDIVDIYDVATETWTVEHLSTSKSFLTAGSVGDKVFFAGGITEEGWGQTNLIEIYDIAEDSWSWAYLSEPKINVGIVTTVNKIYFAGGFNYLSSGIPGSPYCKTVDIYDASANSWSTTYLNEIAGDVSGVAYNEKIYWAGITPSGTDSKVEIWNTQTGSVTTSCLSYPRTHPTAVVRNNDILFFNTGSIGTISFYGLSDHFDIYNSLTDERSIGYLNQSIGGAAVISINNVVYMAGGITANGYSDKVYTLTGN